MNTMLRKTYIFEKTEHATSLWFSFFWVAFLPFQIIEGMEHTFLKKRQTQLIRIYVRKAQLLVRGRVVWPINAIKIQLVMYLMSYSGT